MEKNRSEAEREAREAVLLWACMMGVYALMGIVWNIWNIYLGVWVNIIFSAVCVARAVQKGKGLYSLGMSKEGAGVSCRIGLLCAAVILVLNGILPGVLGGRDLAPAGAICIRFLYFLFIIAFPEEIIFRGYLMTRLEAAKGSWKQAVLLSGLLFVLIHIPYQYIVSGEGVVSYLLNGNLVTLLMTFIWHLVFCALFKKTKSLYGSILFHGIMDWSNYLYV